MESSEKCLVLAFIYDTSEGREEYESFGAEETDAKPGHMKGKVMNQMEQVVLTMDTVGGMLGELDL